MSLYGGVNLVGRPDLDNIMRLDGLPMKAVNEMTRVGFAIDREWFWELSSRLDREMRELRAEITSWIPSEKLDEFISRSGLGDGEDQEYEGNRPLEDWSPMNVDSNDQLSTLFFDVLGIGRGKQLKMTKGGTRISTGKKQLEQLKCNHPPEKSCTTCHPVVRPVLAYKERAKLKSTYSDALPRLALRHLRGPNCPICELDHWAETYRIHAQFPSTRTSTGRFSSKKPNLQNIPARTELGAEIRKGFIATPGCELVDCDFGQFEMRLGAHYSQDKNLLRIFREGLDPHTDTAMRAFGKSKAEVESKQGKMLYRAPCKNVNFGIFYGLTGVGLLDLMALTYATAGLPLPEWCTVDWCEQFIKDWFGLYPGVQDYIDQQHYRARRYGIVWTLLGRVRRIPEVYSQHGRIQNAGLRQAGNAPVQGTQADLNKLGIAAVEEEVVDRYRAEGMYNWPLVTVHDELILEVEEGYGEMIRSEMERVFSEVMRDQESGDWMCQVPITADGKVTARWEK